jgi:hypothetical protein
MDDHHLSNITKLKNEKRKKHRFHPTKYYAMDNPYFPHIRLPLHVSLPLLEQDFYFLVLFLSISCQTEEAILF